jgi:citrate synthase
VARENQEAGLASALDRYGEGVRALIGEALTLPADRVTDGLSFGDVSEWDSLGHMNLLMALEERYGIPLDEDMIARLVSVQAICAYLEEREHA